MSGFLLAEFATPERARAAAQAASNGGHPADDVLSSSPVQGAFEYLAPPRPSHPIGWVMLIAGAAGAALAYLVQWFSAAIDYPIESGGRPLNSWPAFLLVPYESAILYAGVVGLLGWMWMCGLPRLFHPLFAAGASERAVQDRFLLVFPREDALAPWIEDNLKPDNLYEIDE